MSTPQNQILLCRLICNSLTARNGITVGDGEIAKPANMDMKHVNAAFI